MLWVHSPWSMVALRNALYFGEVVPDVMAWRRDLANPPATMRRQFLCEDVKE